MKVHIVGSGLAGSEAAFFLAEKGISVVLHEMRPSLMTPAHHTSHCAELVCSNSFKSKAPSSAPGMLKAEMKEMNSFILNIAEQTSVPGGEALAVDRILFSEKITAVLKNHPHIEWSEGEVTQPFENEITLFATGPLTSDRLSQWFAQATGTKDLYFYDAIAPIVDASTIDSENSFIANRYDKGDEAAYVNCPLNEQEYNDFIQALSTAEKVPPKFFEKEVFFQGCQPIEAIASGGSESLRFGPMKPVGLIDPKTGKMPHAVLQLRPENESKTAYNLVGFQTKLKYGEQSRIFRMIPALKNAEFFRLGSIHRNTYVCAPKVLDSNLTLKNYPNVFLAGQITGVEGYLESTACGLMSALFIYQKIKNIPHNAPPQNTALGALLKYITLNNDKNYSPTNIHFGLFDPSSFDSIKSKKRDQVRQEIALQAIKNFNQWKNLTERAHSFL